MALKKCTWDNPNKMHMDSAFKLFNKQTNLITTGNVWANTQYSSFIRPYKEIECNGAVRNPGDLLKFDLRGFSNISWNERIRQILWDKDREKSVILYEFKVFHDNKHKEVFGHVLTDYDYKYLAHAIYVPYGCSWWKREDAIYEAMKYICDDGKEPVGKEAI